jgi:hypothetical protein
MRKIHIFNYNTGFYLYFTEFEPASYYIYFFRMDDL